MPQEIGFEPMINPTGPFIISEKIGTSSTFEFGPFIATMNENNCGSFLTPLLTAVSSTSSVSQVITYPSATAGYNGFDIYTNKEADLGEHIFYITAILADYEGYSDY